jgi:CheY-like chemotaxis protein
MTGYEAASAFRRHPETTRPVLIAITAWPGESGKLRAEMTGFDHYLAKPADASAVLELGSDVGAQRLCFLRGFLEPGLHQVADRY